MRRRMCVFGRRVVAFLIVLSMVTGAVGCGVVNRYSISGRVTDGQGHGMARVTLSFSGGFGPVVTDQDGSWRASGLSGIVVVTPSHEGVIFTPVSREVSGSALDVSFERVAQRVAGRTSPSGELAVAVPAPVPVMGKDVLEVHVVTKDVGTRDPVADVDIEVVVSGNTLEVLINDPQGRYLPAVIVFALDRLDEYPEIEIRNPFAFLIPLIPVVISSAKAAYSVYKLYKFAAGGLAIGKKAVPVITAAGVAKSKTAAPEITILWALKELTTEVVVESTYFLLMDYFLRLAGHTTKHGTTVYVFESRDSNRATVIKVPAGATAADIASAVRSVTGDRTVEIVRPQKSPSGAYYNPDGSPKVYYVYPVAPAARATGPGPTPPAKPDLVVSDLSVTPASGVAGRTVAISLSIQNRGSGLAAASTTNLRLNTWAGIVTTADHLLTSIAVPAVAAGRTWSTTVTVTIPSERPAGTHYVWAIADVRNIAGQSDESNDTRATAFTVTPIGTVSGRATDARTRGPITEAGEVVPPAVGRTFTEYPGELARVSVSARVNRHTIHHGETLNIQVEMEFMGPESPILGRPVVIMWNEEWQAVGRWFIDSAGKLVLVTSPINDPEPYRIFKGDKFTFNVSWNLTDARGNKLSVGKYRLQATIDSPHSGGAWKLWSDQEDVFIDIMLPP